MGYIPSGKSTLDPQTQKDYNNFISTVPLGAFYNDTATGRHLATECAEQPACHGHYQR